MESARPQFGRSLRATASKRSRLLFLSLFPQAFNQGTHQSQEIPLADEALKCFSRLTEPRHDRRLFGA